MVSEKNRIGERKSKARRLMIKLFKTTDKYLSAKEIFNKLGNDNIGIATIYRNLDLMEKEDIITGLEINGTSKYKIFDSIHQHHLICESCGKIIDIRKDCVSNIKELIEEFSEFLENKYDFSLKKHNLDFIGLCKNCNKKKEE